MNNKILLASVASLALAAAAYASDKSHEGGSSKSNEKEREIHWEYEGEGNPKNWGHLKKEFLNVAPAKLNLLSILQNLRKQIFPILN